MAKRKPKHSLIPADDELETELRWRLVAYQDERLVGRGIGALPDKVKVNATLEFLLCEILTLHDEIRELKNHG